MKSTWRTVGAVLLLATLLLAGWWLRPVPPKVLSQVDCPDLTQACQFQHAGHSVLVQTDQPPSALQPFRLTVTGLQGALTARFGMAGMDMGPIAVPLQTGDLQQVGRVVLPFCVQGRRDWRMWLDGEDGRIEVRFTATR